MTREPTVSAEQGARHELIARLHEMSAALEAGDDALFSERLHTFLKRRDEGFYLKIAHITEELQKAFQSLESDRRWTSIASELPDAGARLNHVLTLTEDAAHHTLDLVEQGQGELRRMAESIQTLGAARAHLFMAAAGSGAAMQAASEVQQAETQLRGGHQALRGRLSELAQAQEYQDLSGQILRRVTHVVREVESALLKLLEGRVPAQARPEVADSTLEGPTVPGLGRSAVAADQADADALLAMFMQ